MSAAIIWTFRAWPLMKRSCRIWNPFNVPNLFIKSTNQPCGKTQEAHGNLSELNLLKINRRKKKNNPNTLPWESEGQADERRARLQPAAPQQAPSLRDGYHCKCETCSGGWWPWPRALEEETSPGRAWSHTVPSDDGCCWLCTSAEKKNRWRRVRNKVRVILWKMHYEKSLSYFGQLCGAKRSHCLLRGGWVRAVSYCWHLPRL